MEEEVEEDVVEMAGGVEVKEEEEGGKEDKAGEPPLFSSRATVTFCEDGEDGAASCTES